MTLSGLNLFIPLDFRLKLPTNFSDEAKIMTTATGAGLPPMCQTLIDTNYQELVSHSCLVTYA
jgi:hypothetical protein